MQWSDRFNRFVPELGPERYKSYSLAAPLATHWKPANCEQFECDEFLYGFVLTVDTSTELGQRQYHYLTHDSTRKHSMQKVGTTEFKFIYGPGNEGMGRVHGEHRVPIGRPPFLLVADGDFRGNPRGTRPMHHRREQDWVDDFASHLDKLDTALKRG